MDDERLHLGPLPRQMGGAHVVALGAGPFAQVAHVDGSPLEIGRGAFPEFLGRMCLSSMQWSITNDSFVNEPRRALCTFWADRGSSYSLLDTEIYDTPPCM